MPIWRTIHIDMQPTLSLRSWQIFETIDKYQTRHFLGYCDENFEGRVSSPIIEFDRTTMKGKTRSGRVYQLVGSPGINADADYVLAQWLAVNKVDEIRQVDYQDENDTVPSGNIARED